MAEILTSLKGGSLVSSGVIVGLRALPCSTATLDMWLIEQIVWCYLVRKTDLVGMMPTVNIRWWVYSSTPSCLLIRKGALKYWCMHDFLPFIPVTDISPWSYYIWWLHSHLGPCNIVIWINSLRLPLSLSYFQNSSFFSLLTPRRGIHKPFTARGSNC